MGRLKNTEKHYTTDLDQERIKELLFELNEDWDYSVDWSGRKSAFFVKKKSVGAILGRVPLYTKMKGTIKEADGKTEIALFPAHFINVQMILFFVLPTLLILFYTGTQAGVDLKIVAAISAVCVLLTCILEASISQKTQMAENARSICVARLEQLLCLRTIDAQH